MMFVTQFIVKAILRHFARTHAGNDSEQMTKKQGPGPISKPNRKIIEAVMRPAMLLSFFAAYSMMSMICAIRISPKPPKSSILRPNLLMNSRAMTVDTKFTELMSSDP